MLTRSSTPEIHIEQLQTDDLFMVLACDGIWDVLSDSAVIDIAAEYVQNPTEGAQAIVRAALAKGSGDNLTATMVVFGWVEPTQAAELLEKKRAPTSKAGAPKQDEAEVDMFS